MRIKWNELYQTVYPAGGVGINSSLTPGKIILELIPYIFTLSGLLLLLYLLYGGIRMMVSAGEPKAMQESQGIVTNALLGFVIIFVSYWVVQLVAQIFGITVVKDIFK